MENQKKFAVLIDADNVSPERFERIFGEISLYGVATYRRIYGNWAEYNRSMLKEKLVEYALTPVQQFNYIKGKNATDIAMVIEAMDILYTGEVDGFAIVTNDSDFTRLALRLRESGMMVIGMGDDVAPASFRAACTDFIVLRESRRIAEERTEQKKLRLSARRSGPRAKITAEIPEEEKPEVEISEDESVTETAVDVQPEEEKQPEQNAKVLSDRELRSAIRDFLYECEEDDGWFSASTMVNKLKQKFPNLDVNDYADLPLFAGKRKIWTTYFLALGFCENRQKGPSNYLLRLKPEERAKMKAERKNAGAEEKPAKAETEAAAEIDVKAAPAKSNQRSRSRGRRSAKPAEAPVNKPAEAQASKPAEAPVNKPAEKPAEEAAKPAEEVKSTRSRPAKKAKAPAKADTAAKAETPEKAEAPEKTEAAEAKAPKKGRPRKKKTDTAETTKTE